MLTFWYPKGLEKSLVGYLDSDFAGCKLDRKSTTGTCHLLGISLVSWNSKKQTCVALSTTEVKYIMQGVIEYKSCGLNNNFMILGYI